MKSRRWRLQYSLRTFFVLLMAAGVWLGVVVNRAREQCEAVKAIQGMGGFVLYNWHFDGPSPAERPHGPAWLQRLVGEHFFEEIDTAAFPDGRPHPSEVELLKFVPRLQRMRGLKTLYSWPSMSDDAKQAIKAALPACRIRSLGLHETHPPIYRTGYEPPPGPRMLSKVIDSVKKDRRENPTNIGP